MPAHSLRLLALHTTTMQKLLARRTVSFCLMALAFFGPALATPALAGSQRETPMVLAVRRAGPAVVNISSEKTVGGRSAWDGALSDGQRVNGMGSGVIIDERGYIITNAHVVDRVSSLRVKLADGNQFEATTVAIDRTTDLALLKIDAGKPLPTIPMGTSSDLMVGETVIAIGNAYGYENTMTGGYISALGRTVRLNDEMTYHDLIQTCADINPGNSGGALLNIEGELVGVNVAIRAGAQGISFAIPVNTVRRIAADMVSIRKINHTWHGLQYEEASAPNGGLPEVVAKNVEGPSLKAGIHPGDRIVRIDHTAIQSGLDFERSLLGLRVGDQASVVVRRGQGDETLQLTIEDLPKVAESPTEMIWRRLGLRLSSVDPYQIQRYQSHLRGGMYVVQVQAGSPAAKADIRPGDFLVGLQKWETLNYDNVLFVLSKHDESSDESLAAHVLRNGDSFKFELLMARSATKTESRETRAISEPKTRK